MGPVDRVAYGFPVTFDPWSGGLALLCENRQICWPMQIKRGQIGQIDSLSWIAVTATAAEDRPTPRAAKLRHV